MRGSERALRSLARAASIPARDVYGIRTAKSDRGYKSLGTSSETITKSQHCRAEVYLTGYGWVADLADVRKVVLEEPPGNRSLDDEMVKTARTRLFGSWEMNWMAFNFAHDVELPGAKGGFVPFLMYPQAETDQQRLDVNLVPDRNPGRSTCSITAGPRVRCKLDVVGTGMKRGGEPELHLQASARRGEEHDAGD